MKWNCKQEPSPRLCRNYASVALLLRERLQWLPGGRPAENCDHPSSCIQVISVTRWRAQMSQVVLYQLWTDINTDKYRYKYGTYYNYYYSCNILTYNYSSLYNCMQIFSYIVWQYGTRLRGVWETLGWMSSKRIWKVLAYPKRTHRSRTNREEESKREMANAGSFGKWPNEMVYCVYWCKI